MTDAPPKAPADGAGSSKRRGALRAVASLAAWVRNLESVYRVGLGVAVFALVVTLGAIAGFLIVSEEPPLECSTLRTAEVERSEQTLISNVEDQLEIGVKETDGLLSELNSLGSELDAPNPNPEGETRQAEARSRAQEAAMRESVTRDLLLRLYRDAEDPPDDLIEHQESLALGLDEMLGVFGIVQIEEPVDDRASAEPGRSTVKLDADGKFPDVALGSSRADRRQEIKLIGSTGTTAEQGSEAVRNKTNVGGLLLDKPEYETDFGQFVSADGDEIPRESIHVWARRLGSDVLLSVCIDPEKHLGAAKYEGEVYLEDATLEVDSVFVSVTAQDRRIDLLYLLLVILPPLAMVYVWYTTEQPQSGTAFNLKGFLDWAQQNFVVLLGVGLASVWTTLQVAFGNATLGSSLFGTVAVVGGAAVAAVTAMTTIAVTAAAARRRAANDLGTTES